MSTPVPEDVVTRLRASTIPFFVVIATIAGHATLVAQSRTRVEFGGGAVMMHERQTSSGPIGIAGQIGVRRQIAGRTEARVGITGLHRKPGETGIRVTSVGLTGEVATPITRGGGLMIGGGMGLFAVDMYQRGFDDAVRVSTGAVALIGTIGSRHAVGRTTLDLRLRALYGDLGATGRTTLMLGLVVAP